MWTMLSRPSRMRVRIFGPMWALVLVNFVYRAALSISFPSVTEEFMIPPDLRRWILGSLSPIG